MKTEKQIFALETFYELIVDSKNKDAALSKFDRYVKDGVYSEPEFISALRILFQPIRDQRFKSRQLSDIGGVVDKIQYNKKDVDYNLRQAKKILSAPERKEDVLLSLLLVTGRRTSEVCGFTKFQSDIFIGTLKGGHESGIASYLCDFKLIDKGIKFLAGEGWRNLQPDVCNSLVAVPAMRRLKVIFRGVNKVHDLRKLHITIAVDRLRNSAKFKNLKAKERTKVLGEFINNCLGHSNPSSALPYLNSSIV